MNSDELTKAPTADLDFDKMDEKDIMREIAILSKDLKDIEDSMSKNLEVLKENIGQEYIAYSQNVLTIGQNLHELASMSGKTKLASRLEFATAAFSFGTLLWGKHKQYKAHNDYLDKLMAVKQSTAKKHIESMSILIPRLERSMKISDKLLTRFWDIEIPDEALADDKKLLAKTNQGLTILELYRSASFFTRLGNYIRAEAMAWTNGEHTSGELLPGYSDIHDEISERFYSNDDGTMILEEYYNLLQGNVDTIKGHHLLLATDPQLTYYILNSSSYVTIYPDDTPIGHLVAMNPAVEDYNTRIGNVTREIESLDPKPNFLNKETIVWSIAGIITILLLLNTGWCGKIIIGLLYIIILCITMYFYDNKIKELFYFGYNNTIAEGNLIVKQQAGYVDQPSRDFEKKSLMKDIKKFFKLTGE